MIAPDEAALGPGGPLHAEHAIILLEETAREDQVGAGCDLSFHLRAKILAPQGRDLANVEIPAMGPLASLRSWWGRTLLPDGRVLELPKDALRSQTVARVGGHEVAVLRGALPGVVEGAVIDYGWTVRYPFVMPLVRVSLQRDQPVLRMRYRWKPGNVRALYRFTKAAAPSVVAEVAGGEIVVSAHDIAPFVEEPYMPPRDQVESAVYLYYAPFDDGGDLWGDVARWRDDTVTRFNKSERALRAAIAQMHLPEAAPLRDRLRAVYDWIGANVEHTGLRSAEEAERERNDARAVLDKAKKVLDARKGDDRDLDMLFVGLARLLGAEAYLVLAPDRSVHLWEPGLRTSLQFDRSVAAVREPGRPDGGYDFVDAGSGLPYGEVPWQVTGTASLLCTPDRAREVQIPPAPAERNVAAVEASVRFAEGNEALLATWTREGTGQAGFDERRTLRAMASPDRRRMLDGLCRAGVGVEVVDASAPGLDAAHGPLRLECSAEIAPASVPGEGDPRYVMPVDGPWFDAIPDVIAKARIHPVAFPYPRLDRASVTFAAPSGFSPGQPPAPVHVSSPFGTYSLSIERVENGFRVTRSFSLLPLIVRYGEYESLRTFLSDVRNADRARIEFLRAGAP